MYKLFTLALFALVLSACGRPPAPLSDSCRTFNPFAADCTGEEAEEVQRETCIFNPGFHPNCRGDAGAIAGYCRDTNNPNNVLHKYCAEELTPESLTAAYTASCKVTPEIRDDCPELLVDFCKNPDDPFHNGCRTSSGIGSKQATACTENPNAHATCTKLLEDFCDFPRDLTNYYHPVCDGTRSVAFYRAFHCEEGTIPLDICTPYRFSYCTTVAVNTNVQIVRNFQPFCDNIENIESIRTRACDLHFITVEFIQEGGQGCEEAFEENCKDTIANPTYVFYDVCVTLVDVHVERAKVCLDFPDIFARLGSDANVDDRGCNDYTSAFCRNNPFNTDIDEKCPAPTENELTRDENRARHVDGCDGRETGSICLAAYSFCEMNRDNSACVNAPIRPNRAAWEASFSTALESNPLEGDPTAGNKFLIDAVFPVVREDNPNRGAVMRFTNTRYDNVLLDIEGDNRSSGVGFFTQTFSNVAYYYAGVGFDAKLGEPLTTETAKGTWQGGLRAVIGNTLMPASVDMELTVTFNPPNISAFVPVNGNHFLLEGVFSPLGVISGTVNYGAFMDDERTTPMGNRGKNGTLTGLIGDYGAVGVFVSGTSSDGGVTITGGMGTTGYAGGFVVIRRAPE